MEEWGFYIGVSNKLAKCAFGTLFENGEERKTLSWFSFRNLLKKVRFSGFIVCSLSLSLSRFFRVPDSPLDG